MAVSVDEKEDGAVITQRNKFLVGDTLDVLPPDGRSFFVTVEALEDEYGNMVESAPHPMQRLYLHCNKKIPKGSVIRKKNIDIV